MTADDFRVLALALQGVDERAHMGHPDFRAGGRIFASLASDEQWGTVKLAPGEQRELVRATRGVFVPAAGAWGRQGWTKIRLDDADEASVRGALLLAWQLSRDQKRRGRSRARKKVAGRRRPGNHGAR
jgi:hypothetical protein